MFTPSNRLQSAARLGVMCWPCMEYEDLEQIMLPCESKLPSNEGWVIAHNDSKHYKLSS